jgi:AcrR family transcriptional regulator
VTTRDNIFSAALDMFLRLGYEGTTLDAVADAVGVTKPAIYYHFKSKEELFKELFRGLFEGMAQGYFALLELDESTSEMLDSLFGALSMIEGEFSSSDNGGIDLAYLPLMIDGARRFPELREILDGFYAHSILLIAARLEAGKGIGEVRIDLDSNMAATALIAQFEGLLLVSSIAPSCDYRGMEPGIVELFRRGMEPA